MILEDAGSPVWELDNAGGTFRIFNPGTLRFAIDPSGNVGIGTASPTAKLHVVGNLTAPAGDFTGDTTGMRGTATSLSGGSAGVLGIAGGPDTHGVRGENTSPTGFGVVGQVTANGGVPIALAGTVVSAPNGIAAELANLAGGLILLGRGAGANEVFSVGGDGTVAATAFVGDGSGVTNVNADTIDGLDSTQLARADAPNSLSGNSSNPILSVTQNGVGPAVVFNRTTAGTLLNARKNNADVFFVDDLGNVTANGAITVGAATRRVVLGTYLTSSSGLSTGSNPAAIDSQEVTEGFGIEVLDDLGNSVFRIDTSASSDQRVAGRSDDLVGVGVVGIATHPTGSTDGVRGASQSTIGVGVRGLAHATTGVARGVEGSSNSTSGIGVFGRTFATSGSVYGVDGDARSSPGGTGVQGLGGFTGVEGTSALIGVRGITTGPTGTAGWFESLGGGKILKGVDNLSAEVFSVSGNGTVTATKFVGDGSGLTAVGVVSTGVDNTAVGASALASNVSGTSNTAFGAFALDANTSGTANTALGSNALGANTSSANNTAVGTSALAANTASSNTAVGAFALDVNNTGTSNTAVGANALDANTSGASNTAVGVDALAANVGAANNTAVGAFALDSNTSGTANTAVGKSALGSNTGGNNNTAVGSAALILATGSGNIGIGESAGVSATTGDFNIYIGNTGVAAESSTIRIGTSQTATFIAGIHSRTSSSGIAVLTNSSGKLGTTTSSRRFKEDIQDMGEAGRRLLRLRPVQFRYKPGYDDGTRLLQYGLIAEEVAEVMPELVVFGPDGQPETVRYHFLAPLLLSELQRQEADLRQQQAQNDTLRAEVASLKAELEEAKQVLAQVANEVRVLRARR